MTMQRRLTSLFCGLVFVSVLFLPRAAAAQGAANCAYDVTVASGDTLTELAERYLDDALAYPRIIAATNTRALVDSSYDAIEDEATIKIGWKLCIPAVNASVPANPISGGEAAATPEDAAGATVEFDGSRLTIDFLRSQRYPGSPIQIEEVLSRGSNYNRYLVSYRSEGLKIYALMTVPRGTRPATGWPVIIFNHGYIPPEIYRPTERYVAYVDSFARNGYIVFRPDYRGHGFSEGEARGAYGAPDYTVDVLNAVSSVKRYSLADPNRIGMWGHSMGGYITLRAMVTNGDVKAGVVWAGVVASYPDLIERWTSNWADVPESARRWRTELLTHYGPIDADPEFWASISANSYLADLSGPVQIHHGTADDIVPVQFSVKLYDQLKAAGVSAEIYTYLDDDHNITQNLDLALARSLAYFNKHVKFTPPRPARES
jgi:dienelactone hydrolase